MVELADQTQTERKDQKTVLLAERGWWSNVMGPAHWNGKLQATRSNFCAVDTLSRFRQAHINGRIADHLQAGDTVVFASQGNKFILVGDLGLLIMLDSVETDKLLTGRENRIGALKGDLEAHISTGRGISFFNIRVGETYLGTYFNMDNPSEIPTIYAVSNPKSFQDHRATLLIDKYKGTRKLVLKSTA